MRLAAAILAASLVAQTALSLDGYILTCSGEVFYQGPEIALVNCANGQKTVLATGGGYWSPVFSPDGKQIAYWRNGSIYVMNNDGTNVRQVCQTPNTSYKEQVLTWCQDGWIYFSQQDNSLYRARVSDGTVQTIHTSSELHYMGTFSQDGSRWAGTKPSWSVLVAQIGGSERNFGDGCQGSVSPNGAYVTHNLGDHRSAYIHNWSDGSVAKTITSYNNEEFNMHLFSRHTNDYVVYSLVAPSPDDAVVIHWPSNTSYKIGDKVGAPFDFWPGLLPPPGSSDPAIALSPTSLSFSAMAGGSNPASQDVNVTNSGGGTLANVTTSISYGSGSNWLTVTRSGSGNSQTLTNSVNISGLTAGTYTATVSVSAQGASNSPQSYTVTLTVSPSLGPLPAPWQHADIGAVSAAGNAGYSSGTFTVLGSGADIWDNSDEFHYVYRTLSGDGEIVARVASIDNTNAWAKAGVMMRGSLDANAVHAMVIVTPSNGTNFQRRTSTGAASETTAGSSSSAPRWVRLVRSGNTFTGYESSNGSNWSQIGSVAISMGADIYVGLVVTSHNDGVICTATFDNVNVTAGGSGNQPPVVSFETPTDGASFSAGVNLYVKVNASDPDGTISNVKLYLNGAFVRQENSAPYEWGAPGQNDPALQNMAAGTYTLTAEATDNGGATAPASITITVVAQPTFPFRVNCGTNEYEVEGWVRDDPYVSGGEDFTFSSAPDTNGVANAAPVNVYRTCRHYNHSYNFSWVPNGTYIVRLHFYDQYGEGRKMDYTIEGVKVLDDFTPAAGIAIVKDFTVTVSDGNGLQIVAEQDTGNDVFECGIEILEGGSTPVPTTVAVTPQSVTIDVGGSQVFSAQVRDQWGQPMSASVQWSVSGGGTVSPTTGSSTTFYSNGTVGTFTVTATAGNAQGTATVTIVSGPWINISSPAAGDVWYVGTTRRIKWTASSNLYQVTISYSHDGGSYWPSVATVVNVTDSVWGNYPWTVPNTPSTQCIVKVAGYMGECQAESGVFEIRAVTDSDGDGMDDNWEQENFGTTSRDGNGDFDGDGISDYQEFMNGTDPTVKDGSNSSSSGFSCAPLGGPGGSGLLGVAMVLAALLAARTGTRR